MNLDHMLPPGLARRYRPLRLLGRGAMGVVVAAEDTDLGREVAIKRLACAQQAPILISRFLREAEMLARMEHPGVMRIYDVGQEGEELYLVSELLEGCSLDRLPETTDGLPLMLEAAEAIEAVHEQGLVHRDIKPANLFLTTQGRVVLLDFGLALDTDRTRLTVTGTVVGTPAFMAPEILRGESGGTPVDWYSWGATLFWLYERRAFREMEEIAQLACGMELDPPPLEKLSGDSPVGRLIRATTANDPALRPSTANELRQLAKSEESEEPGERTEAPVQDISSHSPAPDSIGTARAPARRQPSRIPRVVLVALVALVAAAGVLLSPSREVPGGKPVAPPREEPSEPSLVEAVSRELDRIGPPELPLDPVHLLALSRDRPALAAWIRRVATTPPEDLADLVSPGVLDLEDRLVRIGYPAPLSPLAQVPRAPPAARWEDLDGIDLGPDLDAVVADLVSLREAREARRTSLSAGDDDLPLPEWHRFTARVSGVETLVEHAFFEPRTRAPVAAWLREGAPAMRRICRRSQQVLVSEPPEGYSRLALVERLIRAISEVEMFLWSEVAFLPPELVLGPPSPVAAGWLLRANVLGRMTRIRRSAGVPVEELERVTVASAERAIELAQPRWRRRVAWRALQALRGIGKSIQEAAVHPHMETLLSSTSRSEPSWVLHVMGERWLGRAEDPQVIESASRLLAWYRDHPAAALALKEELATRLALMQDRFGAAGVGGR